MLSVLPHTDSTRSVSICEGESFYAGGAMQSSAGIYVDSLLNHLGCDSILTTMLSVLPHTDSTRSVSICEGESFFAGGANQSVGGIYTDTLANFLGCDSILTTVLSIMPLSYSAQSLSICFGDSVFLGGAYRKQEGVFYDTLFNYLGCDSILTSSLSILPVSGFSQDVFICQGESYFAGGDWQFLPGVYSDTLSNAAGCDSVVVTTIVLKQVTDSLQEVSICNGQSYYCGGNEQTESGIYIDTLVNVAGCDSVLTTVLTVLMNSVETQNLTICTGDSVFAGGAWQDEPGVYTDHYLNAVGCDSTLITTLSLWPLFTTEVYVSVCDGENYFAGGNWHAQSGTYVDSLTAVTGCDSTVITYLTVLPPVITHVFPSICEGENYLAGGYWQVSPGIYYDTLQSSVGCDSLLITHLNVNPNPVVSLGNDTSICEGTVLLISGGDDYQSFYWQDESTASFFEASQEGIYWVVVTNTFGCSATDTMEIQQVYPLPENFLSADTVICGNLPVTVSVSGYNKYEWFDGSTSSSHTFTNAGTYSLLVTDDRGCRGSDAIHLENACDEDFFMPNAFSPNSDGLNDVFLPIPLHPFTDFDLRIFNRWGMMVFESDDLSQGWDGREKGIMGEIGTYLWKMEYTLEDGSMKSASGSVILLR
jgi:gliding motility-associated-like protein